MYKDQKLRNGATKRVISASVADKESTWHRDENDRVVVVTEGNGWSFQRDNELPISIKRGDVIHIEGGEWHRVIPGSGDLTLNIREIAAVAEDEPEDEDPRVEPADPDRLLFDLIRELSEEAEPLDLDGTELVDPYQTSYVEDAEGEVMVSENDLIEALLILREGSKKKINPDYLTKDAGEMRDEIRKQAKKADDDPTAYKSHPKGDWKADYSPSGKRYKTKTSPHTAAFHKRFGESDCLEEGDEDFILEGLNDKIRTALKNKAEKANAPLSALTTVYRKGLAAWKTGHKPGASQHAWAMGRVNSFLVGGPARRVDAAQWKQVQDFRKKKRKD
jgi:mannose-6-phosphate isomerase-like protein (cupin superfamily)